jgi:hypothetical protein
MPETKPSTQEAQSGAEYAVFQKDVGTWDAHVIVRPGPGQAEQVSRGVSVSRLAAGGRWLITDFRNETTGFEGHGVYGWDPTKKKYVGTWVDNMRTSLSVSEGTWDEATRTMTYWNELTRPDGNVMRWREVTETRDADTHVFRSLFPGPNGTEFEMMTVTYTRRAP